MINTTIIIRELRRDYQREGCSHNPCEERVMVVLGVCLRAYPGELCSSVSSSHKPWGVEVRASSVPGLSIFTLVGIRRVSDAFAPIHARNMRTSARSSQKHLKFPPRQVGHQCTSRSLNKHILREGTPLWKEFCHFSRGKFHVVIPTNRGNVDGMLRGVSYVRSYLRATAQKCKRKLFSWNASFESQVE